MAHYSSVNRNHRRFHQVLAILLAIASVACGNGAQEGAAKPADDALFSSGRLVIETDRGSLALNVEIAETLRAKATGLMGRESLPENAGMVFLEQEPVRQSFWMKNTLIPLSIAFWDSRNEIVAILDMEPCRADPCPTYDPRVAWTGAVEVNQGYFTRHEVEVGDEVTLERQLTCQEAMRGILGGKQVGQELAQVLTLSPANRSLRGGC